MWVPPKRVFRRLSQCVPLVAVAVMVGCRNPVTPPVGMLYITLTQMEAAQGDTVDLLINVPEEAAGDLLIVTFSGYGKSVDSLTIPAGVVAYGEGLVIPAEIGDGVLEIQASIPETHQTATDSIVIKDNVPPQITSMQLVPPRPLPPYPMTLLANPPYLGGATFIAGIADTLHAVVSDNHGLGWLFLALGKPINQRDSIRLSGLVDTLTIPIELPGTDAGTAPQLTITLSDIEGNKVPTAYGAVQTARYADYPARSTSLATPAGDLAFDTKRSVIYLAEPSAHQIAVFSSATMSFLTPIAVPGRPFGIDVRPGGDSIVTTLDSTGTIAVIDLTSAQHTTTVLAMPSVPDTMRSVSRVRVASDNRAIVSTYSPVPTYAGLSVPAALAVNLANDSVTVLAGGSGVTTGRPTVLRSPDATWVMITAGDAGAYSSATHNYSNWNPAVDGPPEITSLSNGPDYRYLVDHVFVSWLNGAEGSVGLDRFFGEALSPGGSDAYVADAPCAAGDTGCVDSSAGVVLHYAVPIMLNGPDTGLEGSQQQGQVLTVSDAPFAARSLAVTPDGKTLIGIDSTGIFTLDLTQTTPPPGLAQRNRGASAQAMSLATRGRVRSSPVRADMSEFHIALIPRKTRQGTPLDRRRRNTAGASD